MLGLKPALSPVVVLEPALDLTSAEADSTSPVLLPNLVQGPAPSEASIVEPVPHVWAEGALVLYTCLEGYTCLAKVIKLASLSIWH